MTNILHILQIYKKEMIFASNFKKDLKLSWINIIIKIFE